MGTTGQPVRVEVTTIMIVMTVKIRRTLSGYKCLGNLVTNTFSEHRFGPLGCVCDFVDPMHAHAQCFCARNNACMQSPMHMHTHTQYEHTDLHTHTPIHNAHTHNCSLHFRER